MTSLSNARGLGLVLIGLVLLAVAVIPNLSTRTVPGSAQAAPVEGPPAVGDCVTDPIDPGWNTPGVLETSGTTRGTYIYPQVGLSRCQGGRYGEVTALIATPTQPLVTTTSAGSQSTTEVTDSNMESCQAAAYRYVGITVTVNQTTPLLGGWYAHLVIDTAASTPSVRQQAAGQHWLACIAYLRPASRGPFAAQERYVKSLRNALITGEERDRTGVCVAAADLKEGGTGLVGCGTDHQSEIFGLSTTGNKQMARIDLQRSCHQVVTRLMQVTNMPPGGLTVQVLAANTDKAAVTSASIPAHTSLTCGVSSGNRVLRGSLLALGTGPIPWK